MSATSAGNPLVRVTGQVEALVERLSEPLAHALGHRRQFYSVQVEAVGRVGEILVSVTGSRGARLPLLFARGDLDPAFVSGVVRTNVEKFGL